MTTADDGAPQYCPGVPQWTQPVCRTQEDCAGEYETCVAYPSDCPGPGCESNCERDADCDEGVCVRTGVGCCGDAGNCAPACTADSCAADETCEPDGHCRPIACDAGFDCAAGFACTPGGAGADRHGCVPIPCDAPGANPCSPVRACMDGVCQPLTCAGDDDCPCGSCISGTCWDRPWICSEEPA